MPINRPRRFIWRVYKEVQRGESVRPRETRHCDSREARVKKHLETLYRKKPSSNQPHEKSRKILRNFSAREFLRNFSSNAFKPLPNLFSE